MARLEKTVAEVYVASTPGYTRWSHDYELIAEWAGGEGHVRIWDVTRPGECPGCGREVTLVDGRSCGFCE